ncbi:uncharacterized protein PITG_05148 [Phytophthora infestans T30-4]|uniref:Uncharacterized protein n=1 Tax=Phytophthora infestans (strain T30-4) TaxID=403677 RepID=D0N3N6_PHYIT|nr:uncharacterized protein PITG_05148 [Phytophthora infestans T30-4]EEY68990.1 hypothetical protein PITG_05148 [Phytophthora infestans T30-4]|eukprot:XP_002998844.1 hypothetical protein PITG_05148 [Phytophthora infestans T30-4]
MTATVENSKAKRYDPGANIDRAQTCMVVGPRCYCRTTRGLMSEAHLYWEIRKFLAANAAYRRSLKNVPFYDRQALSTPASQSYSSRRFAQGLAQYLF